MATDVDHLHHLVITLFFDRGMRIIDPVIARTAYVMIIYNPAGLQMRIDRHSSNILESALL
jgi:hypothetical protein